MEPARSIIKKLGGEAAVSRITNTAFTAPYRWQYERERGGTAGKIPARHIPAMLAYAREHAIDLAASEFFAEPERIV
jgi:hypothetical protein